MRELVRENKESLPSNDDDDVPGEDDVPGPGEHEDGGRVLAGLVVQLRGNLVTLPDLEPLHRP